MSAQAKHLGLGTGEATVGLGAVGAANLDYWVGTCIASIVGDRYLPSNLLKGRKSTIFARLKDIEKINMALTGSIDREISPLDRYVKI